jgi:thioredoxin-like negative regulator of GroEL
VPESIEEMLAKGYFGTVIEILEKQVAEKPDNFDAWMKLAEVQGRHCANLRAAEKLVRQIEINPAFNAEQVAQARTRLNEWQRTREQEQKG